MTTEHKVSLVEKAQDTCGLNLALATIDLPKSTWYYHQKHAVAYEDKYAHLRPVLETIIREHPEYGVSRIMPELRQKHGYQVNHKVVERLLEMWDLCILRSTRRPKPSGIRRAIAVCGSRVNLVAQMEKIEPFQVLYTDFTELVYADGHRKAVLIPIIDHASKLAFGWAVGPGPDTRLALRAWRRAKATFRQLNVPYTGTIMHHDRGSAFISYEWTWRLLLKDGLRLSYALRGARDNPEMESFNGRFKTEGYSLFLEARNLAELTAIVERRMAYYNTQRRHSSIHYLPPSTYIQRVRAGSID